MLYRKMIKPDPPVVKKNITHSLTNKPLPPNLCLMSLQAFSPTSLLLDT